MTALYTQDTTIHRSGSPRGTTRYATAVELLHLLLQPSHELLPERVVPALSNNPAGVGEVVTGTAKLEIPVLLGGKLDLLELDKGLG